MTRTKGVFIIAISTLISIVLSNTVDITNYELGALYNWFWPPISGFTVGIIFLLISFLTKKSYIRLTALVIGCSYLIYIGIAFHFETNWPFVIW